MLELKILTIGDAHGRIPKRAPGLVKQYNPDIILCTGDLAYSDKIRKVIFSNWGKSLNEVLSKKKLKELHSEAIKSMGEILKYMDSLGKPAYLIYGNNDYPQSEIKELGYSLPGIEKQAKKYQNIHLMIASKKKIRNHDLVAVSGYRLLNSITEKKKENKSLEKKVKKVFKGKQQNLIFMYHDVPYKTKFDLVKNKASPMNGKHVGDPIVNQIIKKYKPLLYVCGHMHENPGMIKLGKTVCLNTGSVENEDYFLVQINDRKVTIKKIK